MDISLLNLATLLAYTALAVDFVIEIHRMWKRKHSADISPIGMSIRVFAAMILMIKVWSLGDWYLLTGQIVLVSLLIIYTTLIIKYRNNV